MVSHKQLIANRKNGKNGGPKTAEGKRISSSNSLKHGLMAKEVVLPGENKQAFIAIKNNLIADLQPEGQLEAILVDQIAVYSWRQRRAVRIETTYVSSQCEIEKIKSADFIKTFNIDDEAVLGRVASKELGNLTLTANLPRYEAFIVKQLYQSIHELQRLQTGRRGLNPPAPVAIDVNVSQKINFPDLTVGVLA